MIDRFFALIQVNLLKNKDEFINIQKSNISSD